MTKVIQAHWQLQAKVEEVVRPPAPSHLIMPFVRNDDDKTVWDEECRGFGRSEWYVGWVILPDDQIARHLIRSFSKEIDRLRNQYDLGITCA